MKARVKATGVVVDIQECDAVHKGMGYDYISTRNGYVYKATDLDVDFEPDYWEKLKHQYAGMAMQGMVMNPNLSSIGTPASTASVAYTIAIALINKLKEEKQCSETGY